MSHRADCICVTCRVLRERVPLRSEPVYARGYTKPRHAHYAGMSAAVVPEVQRGREVEQAERERFHVWFINMYKYPPFDCGAPTDLAAHAAWQAWRARAIL